MGGSNKMNLLTPETSYISENHLVSRCIYHVIFCPKYRRKVLTDSIQLRLKELVYQQQNEYQYSVIEIETMPDHVHLLIQCSANIHIHAVVSNIKGYLSKILREEFPELKKRLPCLWTHGKFIASVGTVSLEVVKKYIENQKGV